MTDSGPLLSRDCHHRGAAARRTSRDRGAVPGARRLVRGSASERQWHRNGLRKPLLLLGSGSLVLTPYAVCVKHSSGAGQRSGERRNRQRRAQPNPPRRNVASVRRVGRRSRRRSGGVGRRSEPLLRQPSRRRKDRAEEDSQGCRDCPQACAQRNQEDSRMKPQRLPANNPLAIPVCVAKT